MLRIGRQQRVQDGCASSRKTQNKHWCANFFLVDRRISFAVALQKQAITKALKRVRVERELPDKV